MKAKDRKAKEDKLRDEEILKRRVESDKLVSCVQKYSQVFIVRE